MLRCALVITVRQTSQKLAHRFNMFLRILKKIFTENPSQNLNGETDFSQEKY